MTQIATSTGSVRRKSQPSRSSVRYDVVRTPVVGPGAGTGRPSRWSRARRPRRTAGTRPRRRTGRWRPRTRRRAARPARPRPSSRCARRRCPARSPARGTPRRPGRSRASSPTCPRRPGPRRAPATATITSSSGKVSAPSWWSSGIEPTTRRGPEVADQGDPARSDPVEQRAAERLEEHERGDLRGRDEAGLGGRAGGGQHEPRDRDHRDPGADEGDALGRQATDRAAPGGWRSVASAVVVPVLGSLTRRSPRGPSRGRRGGGRR